MTVEVPSFFWFWGSWFIFGGVPVGFAAMIGQLHTARARAEEYAEFTALYVVAVAHLLMAMEML